MPPEAIEAGEPGWQRSARALTGGLLDPERETPAILSGPRGKRAAKRYDVYRNNVTVSLIEALAAVFPATQRITGPDFFRAMARFHIRETPPSSPLLFEYGRDFPDFIARYDYARPMPWLADVARIERAWLDAYHAADEAPLGASSLSRFAPDELAGLRFVPHPSARVVRSRFPAVAIFAANRGEGPVGRIETREAEDALVTRPQLEVFVRRLPPGGAAFVVALLDGETLAAAAGAGVAAAGDFDLAGAIAGTIEAGALAGIRETDK